MIGCTGEVVTPPQSTSQAATEKVAGETESVVDEENTVDKQNTVKSTNKYPSPTPLDAVRNFFEGIVDGKVDQAQSALVITDDVTDYMMANIVAIQAMDNFALADNKYFGEEGAMPIGFMRSSMLGSLDNAETIMIDEEHAECIVNPPLAMKMVKHADGWKIDFTGPDSKQLLEMVPPTFRATAKMFDRVRTGIVDGTIDTRKAARQELKKLKAAYGL